MNDSANPDFLASAWGARWFDDQGRFAGDSPEMIQALEFFADWHREGTITDSGVFGQGRSAMMRGTAVDITVMHRNGTPFAVAPDATGHMPDLRMAAFRFYAGSDIETAWDFLLPLATEPEWQARHAIYFGGLPSSREAFGYYAQMAPYLNDNMLETLLSLVEFGQPRGPGMGPRRQEIVAVVEPYLRAVAKGEMPAPSAVASFGREVRARLGE